MNQFKTFVALLAMALAFACSPLAAQIATPVDTSASISAVSDTSNASSDDYTITTHIPKGLARPDGSGGKTWDINLFSWLDWMPFLAGLVPIVMMLLFFGLPIAIVALLVYLVVRGNRRTAPSHNGSSPRGQSDAAPTERRNRAIRNTALGAGIALMCWVLGFRLGVAAGLLVACIGLGDALIAFLDKRKQ